MIPDSNEHDLELALDLFYIGSTKHDSRMIALGGRYFAQAVATLPKEEAQNLLMQHLLDMKRQGKGWNPPPPEADIKIINRAFMLGVEKQYRVLTEEHAVNVGITELSRWSRITIGICTRGPDPENECILTEFSIKQFAK